MPPEEYIEVGFRGKPKDEQLKEISKTIDKTLETLGVKKYDLKHELTDLNYYYFILETRQKTNIDPKIIMFTSLPDLRKKLESTYDNVMYVGIGQEGIEVLKAIA